MCSSHLSLLQIYYIYLSIINLSQTVVLHSFYIPYLTLSAFRIQCYQYFLMSSFNTLLKKSYLVSGLEHPHGRTQLCVVGGASGAAVA